MKDRKQLNSKGFTLIELLICLAISAFVILAAYSFVMLGTHNYESNSKNASLQEEAGFVINSVGEAIITGTFEKSDIQTVPTSNDIKIILGEQPDDNIIYYDVSEKKLLIYKNSDTLGADKENHLLSAYVDTFNASYVPTSTNSVPGDPTKLIKIQLTINKKNKTASSEHVFEMRN